MLYVTGLYALNIPCSLTTGGDWHRECLDWNKILLKESKDSIFSDYGIEVAKNIPYQEQKFNVANHIRACLDMLEQGDFLNLQGMKKDFICDDKYTLEIFQKAYLLQKASNWLQIDNFLLREYGREWEEWKSGK